MCSILAAAVSVCLIGYGAGNICQYAHEEKQAEALVAELTELHASPDIMVVNDLPSSAEPIVIIEEYVEEEAETYVEEKEIPDATPVSSGLLALHEQNADCVAWITIEGTAVDYPVMFRPQDKDYYIHRDFYGNKSSRGTLYISEICDIDCSDNVIIYGHNMDSGAIFASLIDYKSEQFYKDHRTITLETMDGIRTYEVICALAVPVYTGNDFRYYDFAYASSETAFDRYVSSCKARAYYETGITAAYGDQLLTLSTCEYSQKNGRMLVIAKQVFQEGDLCPAKDTEPMKSR